MPAEIKTSPRPLKFARDAPITKRPFSVCGATEVLPSPSTGFLGLDQFREIGRGFPALFIVQVGVDLHRKAHFGVPQAIRDHLGWHAP